MKGSHHVFMNEPGEYIRNYLWVTTSETGEQKPQQNATKLEMTYMSF